MPQDYPAHLYEPIRSEVANTYLKREFRKYFSSLRDIHSWKTIDADIDDWFIHPEVYSINGIRDYWDGFFGMATGFKLKNGLLEVITAENITWSKEELPLDNTLTTGGNMLYIHESLSASKLGARSLAEFFGKEENIGIAEKWEIEFRRHGEATFSRENFPIIVEEQIFEGNKILATHDGNRRLLRAILEEKGSISAFVGRYSDDIGKPRNYWIATSYLIQCVYLGKQIGTEESYQSTLSLLRAYSMLSESGKKELLERSLYGSSEFVERLKQDLSI